MSEWLFTNLGTGEQWLMETIIAAVITAGVTAFVAWMAYRTKVNDIYNRVKEHGGLSEEHGELSKEHERLSKEIAKEYGGLSKEFVGLTRENSDIRDAVMEIRIKQEQELKLQEKIRDRVPDAGMLKDGIEKICRENAQLKDEVTELKNEVRRLKERNMEMAKELRRDRDRSWEMDR